MIFIQARTGSSRFPGKVLAEIEGVQMVERVLSACLANSSGHSVVALLPEVDRFGPLHEVVLTSFQKDVTIFFGDEQNVYGRFQSAYRELGALAANEPDHLGIVRVCADRPFIQPSLIDMLDHQTNPENLLYNHLPPAGTAGPVGLGAESMSRELAELFFGGKARLPISIEHVTAGLYGSPRISSRFVGPDWMRSKKVHRRFDIDSPEDISKVNSMKEELLSAYPHARV